MATVAGVQQGEEGNASVYDDMKVIGPAFFLDRKICSKKKDTWTKDEPIETNMKKRIDGYEVWAPRANEKWFQVTEDLPTISFAAWELEVSNGEVDIDGCLPHKELWNEYVELCEALSNNEDDEIAAEGRQLCCHHNAAALTACSFS
jgi:hypothetical protein